MWLCVPLFLRLRVFPRGRTAKGPSARVVRRVRPVGREACTGAALVAVVSVRASGQPAFRVVGAILAVTTVGSKALGVLVAGAVARVGEVALAGGVPPSTAANVGAVSVAVGVPTVAGVPAIAPVVAVPARLPRPVATTAVPRLVVAMAPVPPARASGSAPAATCPRAPAARLPAAPTALPAPLRTPD